MMSLILVSKYAASDDIVGTTYSTPFLLSALDTMTTVSVSGHNANQKPYRLTQTIPPRVLTIYSSTIII